MLCRLFASTLVLGSAVVLFAPNAKAQSVDLTCSKLAILLGQLLAHSFCLLRN